MARGTGIEPLLLLKIPVWWRRAVLPVLSWVVWFLSFFLNRTAASGVAWVGCASLRGPLCAGEALLEARTQASVALFKLGAHSATLRPEFGGP